MIAFSTITAFRLVRRLALGQGSTAMYLLVYEEGAQFGIEDDLRAEVEVQMGSKISIGRVPETGVDGSLGLPESGTIRVLRIDRWSRELVDLLDTHVVRLERTGAQFLFLTTATLAEQLLIEAPNFRNRLTEVLRIIPDDSLEGGTR